MNDKSILFVCVENAARSQMAEAFFKKHVPVGYQVHSAGTNPSTTINPLVIEVMKEVGIDLTKQKPKKLSEDMILNCGKAINMGCMDKDGCPALFTKNIVDWKIDDPKGKSLEEIRKIRDEIESKIKELLQSL
ncbi:MAG: arsenate reductase ArsC [Thaumarchaeota archaeon]|nr:arsenate reductase ArsC [Nitrososphaerota archaeon]